MENDLLATFRLFVQHGRPLDTNEEAELRSLFKRHGHVDLFHTQSHWRNSIVTFASTTEAVKVKKALNKTDFRGRSLKVQFMKPTRHVLVRGLPDRMSVSVVKRAFKAAMRVERDGKDFVLTFERLSEARDAVADTRPLDGYTMSFDFGNEDRRERKQFSPRRQNRSPVHQKSREPSPPRSRKRSRSPPRSIRRKISPSPTIEPSLGYNPSYLKSVHKDSVSASPFFESPPTKKNDEVKANAAIEEQPVLADARQAVDANPHCRECSRLMTELMHHVTDHHVDTNQKAVLKAWFDCCHK
jgi:hypothetical protein